MIEMSRNACRTRGFATGRQFPSCDALIWLRITALQRRRMHTSRIKLSSCLFLDTRASMSQQNVWAADEHKRPVVSLPLSSSFKPLNLIKQLQTSKHLLQSKNEDVHPHRSRCSRVRSILLTDFIHCVKKQANLPCSFAAQGMT